MQYFWAILYWLILKSTMIATLLNEGNNVAKTKTKDITLPKKPDFQQI